MLDHVTASHDLWFLVLTRLRVTEILVCRGVCKDWSLIIARPSFWYHVFQQQRYISLTSERETERIFNVVRTTYQDQCLWFAKLARHCDPLLSPLLQNRYFSNGFVEPWEIILGRWGYANGDYITTPITRFQRSQRIDFSAIPMWDVLFRSLKILLRWSVDIHGLTAHSNIVFYSARVVRRDNTFIKPWLCSRWIQEGRSTISNTIPISQHRFHGRKRSASFSEAVTATEYSAVSAVKVRTKSESDGFDSTGKFEDLYYKEGGNFQIKPSEGIQISNLCLYIQFTK